MTPDIEIVLKKKNSKGVFAEQFDILIDEMSLLFNTDRQKIKDLGVLETKFDKKKAEMKFWYAGRPRFTVEISETWRTISYAIYKHFNGLLD